MSNKPIRFLVRRWQALGRRVLDIKNRNKPKIFCLSMQRTGTTSVGEFFKQNGYRVAGWPISYDSKWSHFWYIGDFASIFKSKAFLSHQVFEDSPWWYPEFYKVLYHNFPNSKFILLIRNSDDWFKSMLSHSNKKTLGNTIIHAKIYSREKEFYQLVDNDPQFKAEEIIADNLMNLEGKEEHYKTIYEIRNREIIDFFRKHSLDSLFVCQLEDPLKWKKMGAFFGIDIPDGFEVHKNKSAEKQSKYL